MKVKMREKIKYIAKGMKRKIHERRKLNMKKLWIKERKYDRIGMKDKLG